MRKHADHVTVDAAPEASALHSFQLVPYPGSIPTCASSESLVFVYGVIGLILPAVFRLANPLLPKFAGELPPGPQFQPTARTRLYAAAASYLGRQGG